MYNGSNIATRIRIYNRTRALFCVYFTDEIGGAARIKN